MSISQTLNGGQPSSRTEKFIVPPVAVEVKYRLYKRRFSGLFGFVSITTFPRILLLTPCLLLQIILGIVSAMPGTWFGPIANIGNAQLSSSALFSFASDHNLRSLQLLLTSTFR